MPREFIEIDPGTLHLPGTRLDGADPVKLHDQLRKYGLDVVGMPTLEVQRGSDGGLVIYDGVTRATRVAKYLPGTTVTAEVTGALPVAVGGLPKVRDKL